MGAPARIAAFVAALAVVFAGAAAAGGALDPAPPGDRDERAMSENTHGAEPHGGSAGAKPADPVRGLAAADAGLRLVVDDPEYRRGAAEELAFRIVEDGGATVRRFDVEHERRMHVIVVRRDLTGFQHLHPEMDADGTWRTRLRLPDAGTYRVFADFSHEDEARTLASDLRVDGSADLKDLPEAAPLAETDGGYEVRLDSGRVRAGEEATLRFTIERDGERVRSEPYLGAGGHLVALREGDLAFLHVHPTEHADSVGFGATFPTEGRYRLFLQFKHEGRVETAAFTQGVAR